MSPRNTRWWKDQVHLGLVILGLVVFWMVVPEVIDWVRHFGVAS